MTVLSTHRPPFIARILNWILMALIILLSICIMLMLVFAALMLFPNGTRDSIMVVVENAGETKPDFKALAFLALSAAILASAYLYVAIVVKKIVRTTLIGDPFVVANISRLRTTWIVIALAEIFRMIIMGALPYTHTQSDTALDSFSLDTRLSAWFLVFVIMTMAEVFRIGLELRRDQELTV